ncbi:unnamed protein product [Notodromas monacha]|uniref:Phospholipase A2-like central domain-containing protein n=1 Tax=Notodromas monacha TaxID=399045 RepID=A0A7R9BJL3_9CRUS|nr:unnamed protein product [Notodromas monacha]CAG0915179.1 unnamed protein product [Notodromas monacha]
MKEMFSTNYPTSSSPVAEIHVSSQKSVKSECLLRRRRVGAVDDSSAIKDHQQSEERHVLRSSNSHALSWIRSGVLVVMRNDACWLSLLLIIFAGGSVGGAADGGHSWEVGATGKTSWFSSTDHVPQRFRAFVPRGNLVMAWTGGMTRRHKRYVGQFGDMIRVATGREALLYNAYGNFCGLGGDPSHEPVDETDACCKAHDDCYEVVDTGVCREAWLRSKWLYYDWQVLESESDYKLTDAEDYKHVQSTLPISSEPGDFQPGNETLILRPAEMLPRELEILARMEQVNKTLMEEAIGAADDNSSVPTNKSRTLADLAYFLISGFNTEQTAVIENVQQEKRTQGILCVSKDPCRQAVCQCDKIAAECFAANGYNVKHKRSSLLDIFASHRDPRDRKRFMN